MLFVEEALNIRIKYTGKECGYKLPYAYLSAFEIKEVLLGSVKAVFVKPIYNTESLDSIKRKIMYISKQLMLPAVLIMVDLIPRQRQSLVKDGIPFVVEGKQIYLPFLGVLFQERNTRQFHIKTFLTPSAQLLLLYYLYCDNKEIYLKDLRIPLQMSPMSLSRAAKELAALDILEIGKKGVQIFLYSDWPKKDIYANASKHMINPVEKVVYVERKDLNDKFCIAGENALARYTMLNDTEECCLAVKSVKGLTVSQELIDNNEQARVEIWKYDPQIFSINNVVDRISLALSFRDELDERIAIEVESMLQGLWRQ